MVGVGTGRGEWDFIFLEKCDRGKDHEFSGLRFQEENLQIWFLKLVGKKKKKRT